MKKLRIALLNVAFSIVVVVLTGCGPSQNSSTLSSASTTVESDAASEEMHVAMKAVEPFFQPMPAPGPNDWLATFNEPGQTFDEYINSNPTVPTAERSRIYVLPLGNFTDEQRQVINVTSSYLEAFFGLAVETLPDQKIPRPLRPKDRRFIPTDAREQVRTGFILDDILRPMLPKDAAALIAFTNDDLYPDDSMYYVFGQASLENRVGVWSLFRLDDKINPSNFLRRTIKIAAHETGHMFSMHHCTKYNCVMSGSNHLAETDSHPIDACPECMAKICWFLHISPAERYRKLADLCRSKGMNTEADDFETKYDAVKRGVEN